MPEHLTARSLPSWVEPSSVFGMLEARAADVFWLDAGTDAATGWSFVGTGEQSELPREVRIDVAPADPALPPFTGGWVGWLDYESGAAAAGAPVAGSLDATVGAWLHVTHVVAFDHAAQSVWVLSAEEDLESWEAEVATVVEAWRGRIRVPSRRRPAGTASYRRGPTRPTAVRRSDRTLPRPHPCGYRISAVLDHTLHCHGCA